MVTPAGWGRRPLRSLAHYWIVPILWTVLIFVVSSEQFASGNTALLLRWVLGLLHLRLEPFDFWHHVLRKVGHFIGYALQSAFLFRAWRVTWPGKLEVLNPVHVAGRQALAWIRPAWQARWAVLSVLLSAVVASGDELNQFFIPGRTGRLRDVVLDTLGATFAQALLLAWYYRKPWVDEMKSEK